MSLKLKSLFKKNTRNILQIIKIFFSCTSVLEKQKNTDINSLSKWVIFFSSFQAALPVDLRLFGLCRRLTCSRPCFLSPATQILLSVLSVCRGRILVARRILCLLADSPTLFSCIQLTLLFTLTQKLSHSLTLALSHCFIRSLSLAAREPPSSSLPTAVGIIGRRPLLLVLLLAIHRASADYRIALPT